jgi:23S rRNA-/tRNA-specific pseudouridylate synthase
MNAKIRLLVPTELSDRTLCEVITQATHLSPELAREQILGGSVRLNGTLADRPELRVPAGAFLEVSPPVRDRRCAPRKLYQDDHLLVVSKPAGMPSAPTLEGAAYSVLNWARENCAPGFDPVLIHRLDLPVSGLLVVCARGVARSFGHLFAQGSIWKQYVALVHDSGTAQDSADSRRWPPGKQERLEYPLTWASLQQRAVQDPNGKPCLTEVVTAHSASEGLSALSMRLHTGRTHQIRAHLSIAGTPIVGDVRYGAPKPAPRRRLLGTVSHPGARTGEDRPFGGHLKDCGWKGTPIRICLHAERLSFPHPSTGEPMEFHELPPDDFWDLAGTRLMVDGRWSTCPS